ncbi:MAG: HAD-IC family P-type ATPase [Candidatus Portnoybacteria bacterium]|nr:HAD-IC family P-type ATPase [Candidatus Portnoybacteria bacterium]
MRKPWHSFSIEKTLQELKSRPIGLTEKKVKERAKKFGLNKLPEEKPFSRVKLFLKQFKSPLIYILLIAGIITLILNDYTDTVVIFGAVFLNVVVGYLQENKASQALDKLKKVLKIRTIVFRDDQEKEISQEKLVPGDIVFLRAGYKVPADARIIEANNLRINESALTGEWLAAKKNKEILSKEVPLADRDNMAYLGTMIESGWGRAVVAEIGSKTEIGQLAQMVRETKEKKTPYQKKLAHFGKVIGLIIVVISLAIFVEGMLTGGEFIEMFTTAVAVAVAAIPEGLPVAMTVILALGMQRILKKKGLVRKLASAETLGSTSIILTDKTGTLTKAKMEVAGIYTGHRELLSDGQKFNQKIDKNGQQSHILALKIAMLCNESFIENFEEPMKKWIVRGNPTEKALFLAGIQAGLSKRELEKKQPKIDQFLFDSTYKYAATLHQFALPSFGSKASNGSLASKTADNILYMVGSPEKVLAMSSYVDNDGQKEDLLLADLKKLKNKYESLTKQGLRLIAVAYQKTKSQEIDLLEEEKNKKMVFVGFFALHDPIRKETKEAIQLCRQAGMKPIIVTGDHRLTAQAVAEKLGFKLKRENILEGKDLSRMSDKEFEKKFKDIQIYARVEPAQKLRIVQAWQKKGEVVAMTGDGINDAPALKQADIGLALGSGTDVAKEVSDLVLLTDNFSIIVGAVEQGRAIIDNIRKVITYLLSDSFTEIVLIGMSLLLGWPLPILAAQILWVNLIEDGLPNVALAFEPKEKGLMKQKPQGQDIPLLTREMKVLIFIIGLLTDLFLLGLFFYLLNYSGYTIPHIRSVIFAGLTIDSLFYVFSCKSLKRNLWHINPFSNKFLIAAWLFGLLMLIAALYLAPLQNLLKTVPLTLFDWQLILALGLINIALIEMTKWWFIKYKF